MPSTLRKFASMVLLAAVGMMAGGATCGLATFYVYFIGCMVGMPAGLVAGGWLGWRTPLRDSMILFVSWCSGGLLGSALAKPLITANSQSHPEVAFLEILLPIVGAFLGVALVFLPVRYLVPFAQRRNVAAAMGLGAALWLFWRFYQYAYVWQPG